jgi:hypothetical protein
MHRRKRTPGDIFALVLMIAVMAALIWAIGQLPVPAHP